MKRHKAVVYVLRCADGSLYTGWTSDLEARIKRHRNGTGARYTRSRLPLEFVGYWPVADRSAALRAEAAFKAFTREQKIRALRKVTVLGYRIRKAPSIEPFLQRKSMPTYAPPSPDEKTALIEDARTHNARITTKHGDIVLKFYPDDAPMHAAAFIKLARAGFYDGLTFHRVEPNFVIQGGCPEGSGTGGPGYHLDAEFNPRPHNKGTLAMARTSDPNSAGSQFYICIEQASFLNGQYTVFGDTIQGMNVIAKIRRGDVMEKVTIEPVTAP